MTEQATLGRAQALELFAEAGVVTALDDSLSASSGMQRLDFLVPLAWQLRQRDCERALALADEAEALLPGLDDAASLRISARLLLVRAEVAWLFADLDEAERLAGESLALFERRFDGIGIGDSFWLMASIWAERGSRHRCEECLVSAVDRYRVVNDQLRFLMAQARLLFFMSFRDVSSSMAGLARYFDAETHYHCSVSSWLLSAKGIVARLTGDLGLATKYYLQAYDDSLESGQTRNALLSINNAAMNLADLGDLSAALDWNERSLDLARSTRWPGMIGMCLKQTGRVLRQLGQYEASGKTLREALDVLGTLNNSRNYAIALRYLGDLALDIHDYPAALDWFKLLEERAGELGEPDLVMAAKQGKAQSLSCLDQPKEAVREVASAYALAREQGNLDERIQALHVWAQLHLRHDLPPPEEMTAPNATLHYLNEARELAGKIEGYSVPASLRDEEAHAWAACGNFRKAWEIGQLAAAERSKARTVDAQNRVIAIQVRFETEKARAETEHQRALTLTENRRAEALKQVNVTLETLGRIGQELTANLDSQAVFSTLYRHVHSLVDVSALVVYLKDRTDGSFHGAFSSEEGNPLDLPLMTVDDPDSSIARCAREKREILVEMDPGIVGYRQVSGTPAALSFLYAPLMIGERLMGVICVQSLEEHAYGGRERSIFRTLCSYSAIALDNALAYAGLGEANLQIRRNRQQLLESEKMASLGRLTAGIAHEMNAPLATVRVSLDEVARLVREYDEAIDNPAINPEDHHGIASDMIKALALSKKAGERAATFVRSIKNQTRDRRMDEKVEFDVVEATIETLTLLDHAMLPKRVQVKLSGTDVPLFILGSAGRFSQVMTNLLNNAVDALPEKNGVIELAFEAADGFATVTVRDNGSGISPEILSRIFDPLFTTKPFGEGTGLGLTIVRDIITGELGGSIKVGGEEGKGASFALRFRNARSHS